VKQIPTRSWALKKPYYRYFDFIAENANRYAILLEHIASLRLNSTVISVEGNKHVFIFPPGYKSLRSAGGVFPFKDSDPLVLTAHYDRVEGSPGANDNSIAVFHLLNAALILAHKGIDHWIIIFTDKEELGPGESFEDQGSYTLAKKMKNWGLEKAKIFNFDACGIGDTLIISTTTDHILKDSDRPSIKNVRKIIRQLRDHALETADILRMEKVLLAPTPFSDDVGFLRAGMASQTITMLPSGEAEKYESLLRVRPEFADLIISGGIKAPDEHRLLPETWRNLNNANDSPLHLTPQFYDQIVRFIVKLCS